MAIAIETRTSSLSTLLQHGCVSCLQLPAAVVPAGEINIIYNFISRFSSYLQLAEVGARRLMIIINFIISSAHLLCSYRSPRYRSSK